VQYVPEARLHNKIYECSRAFYEKFEQQNTIFRPTYIDSQNSFGDNTRTFARREFAEEDVQNKAMHAASSAEGVPGCSCHPGHHVDPVPRRYDLLLSQY
jgi:hypothetical protein